MIRITLDSHAISQLSKLERIAELCDPTGKVLGRFVPVLDGSEGEQLTAEVSEEELDRRELANEKRYTTAEVIKHLESL